MVKLLTELSYSLVLKVETITNYFESWTQHYHGFLYCYRVVTFPLYVNLCSA